MEARHHLPLDSLRYCAAPMVDQSDLPFRLQTMKHGATSTWTQMYLASELEGDSVLLEGLIKSLELGRKAPGYLVHDALERDPAPQVVQLAGNDVEELVSVARKISPFADAIDLNLGCPQHHAELGGYGAYLLPKQYWPKVCAIVSALNHSVNVPITTKIRMTVPKEQTVDLAIQLSHAGSSLITVHPRFASSVRRRKGLADLDMVRQISDALEEQGLLRHDRTPAGQTAVVSNGNVQSWADIESNMCLTGASGVMVGETLLENPALFNIAAVTLSPITQQDLAIEYLHLRQLYSGNESSLKTAKQHLRAILTPSQKPMLAVDDLAKWHRHRGFVSAQINAIETEPDLQTFARSLVQP